MKTLNNERLEMMRVMLERVVHGSWDMNPDQTQLRKDMDICWDVNVSSFDLKHWRAQTSCGYAACAIGHACFDPEFNKLGFKWTHGQPKFKFCVSWEAVELFFEFEQYKTARILFQQCAYHKQHLEQVAHIPAHVRQAKMVAIRIEALQSMTEAQFIEQYQAFYTR